MLLKDKVAIVTGGTRGIGRAVVLELLKEGAKVVFTYTKSQSQAQDLTEEIKRSGYKGVGFKADVRDFGSAKELVKRTKFFFGGLDILVNNAGIIRDKPLMLMEEEDWRKVIDTNLTGVFNVTRAVIITFMKQRSGNIVNIASVSGIIGMVGQVNYASSKAGVIGFTKSLAKEVALYNIRVNAVAPGFIETGILANLKEKYKSELLKFIPLGRFGKSEEVAKVVTFLLSDETNYITGQVIRIDGGLGV